MSSIRKIVSIPAKWAAKTVLRGWLLKFPDGEAQSSVACVYCPEMCRFSCPTAVVTGNDAVTPANKMGLVHLDAQWKGALSAQATGGELWPIYDCTGCGRCTEYCVYEMPVADRLWEARRKHGLARVGALSRELNAFNDPYGDLADEWGLEDVALERARAAEGGLSAGNVATPEAGVWIEPKAWEWLTRSGVGEPTRVVPVWMGARVPRLRVGAAERLKGKTWLFHESVWHSRRLNQWERAAEWIEVLRAAGAEVKRPFAQGRDCIDCGGEGAYARMFPEQARAMAREIWERDKHRVQGVITVSSRCAAHFMAVGIEAVGLEEILEWV